MDFLQQIDERQFVTFIDSVNGIISSISDRAEKKDVVALDTLILNFRHKTQDFMRNERKLNIGVMGQVKAGKSSFLNALLFQGKDILPKASTPKTATLTKMEYADENIIRIEYYSEEDWEELEKKAACDLDIEEFESAREIVSMVNRSGINARDYLRKKTLDIPFDTYEDLIGNLNNYVGEDGVYTPIVKSVTLFLCKKEFEGLSIVDTPGLNDPIASRTQRTKEFMEVCDVVFFLSKTSSFLDQNDWTLLSTQLPQKGVKKLVLIASMFDSGIRDVLRKKSKEEAIFGINKNFADKIPEAKRIIEKKLKSHAGGRVRELEADSEGRGHSLEIRGVIAQCENPIPVSSMAYNMSKKNVNDYSLEEQNVYDALIHYSSNIEEDLRFLGNFESVESIFSDVVREKEEILQKKARGFVPDATEELKDCLNRFKNKAEERINLLSGSDRDALVGQKKAVEIKIDEIKSDIAEVFGDITIKLETEKAKAVRELREFSNSVQIKERTGSKTHHGSYTTGHLWWKKTEHYSYVTNYSYFLASDAIEKLCQFSNEACNRVEEVFSESLQLKSIKRRLSAVVEKHFIEQNENYDTALFRIIVEDVISSIEFPVFKLDISSSVDRISGKFSGELTSASDKTKLSNEVTKATAEVYSEICNSLANRVKEYKTELKNIGLRIQDTLLNEVNEEFEELMRKCKNRDEEIESYKTYASILENEIAKLSN